MPSTYAHYRFGREVYEMLPQKKRNIIRRNKELFYIGLHGPDVLFYYHPLIPNRINKIGYKMHEKSGLSFIRRARTIVRRYRGNEAYLSYVYGFICHFALDMTCHGYIDEKIAASGVSHTEIEVEFDRMLMIMDGLCPITHELTGHIIPTKENAEIIKAFFVGTTTRHVKKALKSMIDYNRLLVAPSKIKRKVISGLLRITGNYKEMHGLVVNIKKNPMCEDSNEMLMKLYKTAVKRAGDLITEFDNTNKQNELYDYSFGSKLVERNEEHEI